MAIYQLYEEESTSDFTETFDNAAPQKEQKTSLLSTLTTRLCFLLLFIGDLAWLGLNILLVTLASLTCLCTLGKFAKSRKWLASFYKQFLRSLVCGLSLLVGLVCPPFGIMVACTYFLMYDKAGMDEVVPSPLQEQFKDIFQTTQ